MDERKAADFSTLDANDTGKTRSVMQIKVRLPSNPPILFIPSDIYHLAHYSVSWRDLSIVEWQFALLFLHDVVVFSKTLQQRINHIRGVLSLLKSAGATLKIKKREFFFGHHRLFESPKSRKRTWNSTLAQRTTSMETNHLPASRNYAYFLTYALSSDDLSLALLLSRLCLISV